MPHLNLHYVKNTKICCSARNARKQLYMIGYSLSRIRAKLLESCPALCDPMDCSLPGSSIHGILQSRILEYVAMPSSRGSFQPRTTYLLKWAKSRILITTNGGKMWNKNFHSLLVKMQNDTAALEESLLISFKTKHSLTI